MPIPAHHADPRMSKAGQVFHDQPLALFRVAPHGIDLVDVTAEIVDANQRARFLAGPDSGNTVFAANGNRSAENNFRNQFQAFF